MAQSISKAQADALAEGFFDNLGESKEGLQPKNSLSALYQLAGTLVDEAQNNLNKVDRNASGALSDSLKVLDPRIINGANVVVDVEALYYYQFVDKGVNGTKKGRGSPFSFKHDIPGRKMVKSIRNWIIKEGIKIKNTKKYSAISRRERRRKSITDQTKNAAFAISRSIKQKGLKRTNFFVDAIRTTQQQSKDQLAKGFKIDIINSLPKSI